METARKSSTVLGAIGVFLLAAALIWPLFGLKYLNSWGSIESTFISDARMLRETWNLGGWQPLWYCGTRSDYIYPPALRAGTALLTLYPRMTAARAYHIYIAAFYCAGIAGVYLFALALLRRQAPALLSAAAAALLSPSYLFLPNFRIDVLGAFLLPMRLNVLIRYGEGPHITAFSLLPLALAAAWFGVRKGHGAMLAASAVLSALVVSNNFYGATALALFFPILCWSVWLTDGDRLVWARAAAIGALSYGLTAFWLTPSYFRITLENMRLVAKPGNSWSLGLTIALAAVYGAVSWKAARGRPERAAAVFLSGAFLFFTVNVAGNYYWNFRVIGEPLRLVPEWDMVLILCTAAALFGAVRRYVPARGRLCVLAAATIFLFWPARKYVRHAWELYPRDDNPYARVEYRIPQWLAQNMPGARVHTTGSVRFWLDAWHNIPQVGGGSEQGLLNGQIVPAFWELILGPDPQPSVLWLQSLGADAIVVHDKNSQEMYHDHLFPRKLDGVLPVVFDDGAGNRIYRAPRRFPDLARVVSTAAINGALPIRNNTDRERLAAYVAVVEHSREERAVVRRPEANRIDIQTRLTAGESVLVQETFDPSWHAEAGGKPVAIRKDMMGFMVVDAPPGQQQITLRFALPLENRVGRGITLLTLLLLGGYCLGSFRKK